MENQNNQNLNWGTIIPPDEQNSNQNTSSQRLNWTDSNNTDNLDKNISPSEEKVLPTPSEIELSFSTVKKDYSFLGSIPKLEVKNDVYILNNNNDQAVNDLNNLNPIPRDNDGAFDFSPQENTELGNIIQLIVKIAIEQNGKVSNCFILKNKPGESILNIFRGKPTKSFIYFLQGDTDSGDVILDLSSLGGPSGKLIDTKPGVLCTFPGWIPYSVSKNNSNTEFIAIAGTLEATE